MEVIKKKRGAAMYYCICCKYLHSFHHTKEEVVFKSGFHYVQSNLYPAGLCGLGKLYTKEDQPATA
ncbi:DUF3973 domain-containing protein [Paenibacillus vulneris]|uniref:DUF3973 domain-containing protein n=2 Tax=Paenibacillus TaxID=44249 RepID=A0ABW3UYQ7_9BACL